jgi:hypothetical protein
VRLLLQFMGAVGCAWLTWLSLVYLLRLSSIAALQDFTFWLSPFAFTGWILFVALAALYWAILGRFGRQSGR